MRLTIQHIIEYTNASVVVAPDSAETLVSAITWDSREVTPGAIYCALVGERVDGHTFAQACLEAGAVVVLAQHVLDKPALVCARERGAAVLQVPSVADALVALAAAWRGYLNIPVIALTGSVGKTTTKNLVRSVLATTYKTVATKGNQNNELGVPRTLLEANPETQCLVVEMGMRGAGQLDALCSYVKPTVALITNVGTCHIELLGSQENIAHAKAEVLAHIPNHGTAILKADDAYTPAMREWHNLAKREITTVLFDGSGKVEAMPEEPAGAQWVYATDISLDATGRPTFMLHLPEGVYPCALSLRGVHNVSNACAAAACGVALGVMPENIVRGLEAAEAEQGRQEVHVTTAGITVINDAYNASPDSMRAALALLQGLECAGRRFAVLGDMGELGAFAQEAHEAVGNLAAESGVDYLVCVGELATHIAHGAVKSGMPAEKVLRYTSREHALEYVQKHLVPGDAVLVKASHFMALDVLAKELLE